MKKFLLFILILTLFTPNVFAAESSALTVTTTYNTTVIDNGVSTINGVVFLPLVSACEALGAVVYQSKSDESYFIISRDGDIINHTAGSNFFTLNGENISLELPSTSDNSCKTLVPAYMIEKSFGVVLSAGRITREMHTNYYNNFIGKLLRYCLCDDFYPENFTRYYKFYCANPEMDAGVVINSVNIGLDKTYFEQATTISDANSITLLVNKINRLPDNFTAENLVKVDRGYTPGDGREYLLNAEAYENYKDMHNAAAQLGLKLRIVSAYRTHAYQNNLYNSYARNNGKSYAEKYSARPGYSEHQTGLAVDINSVYTTFENSKEYKWLKDNAHKFGFIERYEKGEEYITGYSYEPWHYRYVGKEAAEIIYNQDITFEEYYAVYVYQGKYKLDKDRTWVNIIQVYYK